jgi:hypothetical protein
VRVLITVVTLIGVLVFAPRLVLAYDDFRLTVFPSTDKVGDNCSVFEPEGEGTLTVYVIYDNLAVTGIEYAGFRLAQGGGFAGVYLGETYPDIGIAVTGNTQQGMWLLSPNGWYPWPLSRNVLAVVQYTTTGSSPPCSWLEVVGWPDEEILVSSLVDGEYHVAHTFGKLSINVPESAPEPECPCGAQTWCWSSCSGVATEPTTWGRIKALYTH